MKPSSPILVLTLCAALIQTAAQSHLFVFTAHHIICDGWSYSIIAADLAEIYSATLAKRVPRIAVPVSFREYALGLRERRDSAEDRD